jgi:hypothetical protein
LVDHHRLDCDGGLQIQIGEEIAASWTTSDHARLPMGRVHSYISNRPTVKPAAAPHRAAPEWLRDNAHHEFYNLASVVAQHHR